MLEKPEYSTHIKSSICIGVQEVEIALKLKYVKFGSLRRVARDTGMDVNNVWKTQQRQKDK